MNYRYFYIFFLALTLGTPLSLIGQQTDSEKDAFFIRTIYDEALTNGQAFDWLTHLTTQIGGRLAGSPQSYAAIEYGKQVLDTLGMDSVWLQSCMVPHWSRGNIEQVKVVSSALGSMDLKATSLGNSIGTPSTGILAEVIEVKSLDEVEALGAKVRGKIVFYNRPMDPKQLRTFNAYGGAVDQRVFGASKAAEFGAVASIVRSMTTRLDDYPHTGTLVYTEGITKVPGMAISTNDAEQLSDLLQHGKVSVYMNTNCQTLSDKKSYNVIGEIKGSTHPDEIILVGGHLDSWDLGQGAHDDGAGCVHAMDVIHILRQLNYQPKRTIRCVLFMNEENGQAGAIKYMEQSNKNNEFHMAAIESDAGGFTPRGFSCDATASVFNTKFKPLYDRFIPLMEPYGLYLEKGGSGADISRLKSQEGLLFGFRPDSQRYFDYHHTSIDTIDAVNERELELGAAAMTSLVYLLDQYGI